MVQAVQYCLHYLEVQVVHLDLWFHALQQDLQIQPGPCLQVLPLLLVDQMVQCCLKVPVVQRDLVRLLVLVVQVVHYLL